MKGMAPAFFRQKIIGDYFSLFKAFEISPNVVVNPSTWKTSFTDTGIPKSAGKNFFSSYWPSPGTQFFLP
jgi:hypothetical protein